MAISDVQFIKADRKFVKEFSFTNSAPMFRKKFTIDKLPCSAVLEVCALGIGYFYINGREVSADRFNAPTSDYTKTLWYNRYNVSDMLCEGENVVCAWCGNGWYNESLLTGWDYDTASWRDNPKFALSLDIDGKTFIKSDDSWSCRPDSAVTFNQLRSGEYFDFRLYEQNWCSLDYDDSAWEKAIFDTTPPKGTFRLFECEGVRECELFRAVLVKKTGERRYLFDIGQNIAGYIRINVRGQSGDELTIRYGEDINDDFSLNLNGMDAPNYYKNGLFQTDKLTLGPDYVTWSPRFAYHGFRYIEVDGLREADTSMVSGVFVHQDIKRVSDFECSDEFLNKLFHAGIYASWSNMHHALTDCPTREKLGWTNDAQASTEQMLTDFDTERLFEKWMVDIRDAMRPDGSLTGTIPTWGWGYHWGNGPVSDGILFEAAYRVYLHSGNKNLLVENLPYFRRYFDMLKRKADKNGFVEFGLWDWAYPNNFNKSEAEIKKVPAEFINAVLWVKFLKIAAIAAQLAGEDYKEFNQENERIQKLIKSTYISEDGRCTINEQTAVSMLIYHDIYDDFKPLKNQLKELVEKSNFHNTCGMVGIRHLYMALNKCSLEDYAFKIVTAHGYPSYRCWIEKGATTLWEMWEMTDSKNHHMYSDVLSWMMKTIIGINMSKTAFEEVYIKPVFFEQLNWAKGYQECIYGKIAVEWKKENGKVNVSITMPEKTRGKFYDYELKCGKNEFVL